MNTAIKNLGLHSWHDFVSTAANRPNALISFGSSSINAGEGFTGTRDFPTAVKMAQDGWRDGANEVARTLDALPPSEESWPDWQLDVGGAICNVPAFISGEPECMWRINSDRRAVRRLLLVTQADYSGGVGATQAMEYAKALAAVTRAVEASGVDIAICAITHGIRVGGRTSATYGVMVREFGEPMDLSKVAFAFHPSFFRRICFAWHELSKEAETVGFADPALTKPQGLTDEVIDLVLGNDHPHVQLSSINDLFSDGDGFSSSKVITDRLLGEIEAVLRG